VLFRLTGVATTNPDGSQLRWRLRKIVWRVTEQEKAVSPACAAHSARVGGAGRGLSHEHDRDLGTGELKRGWKTDYGAAAASSSTGPADSHGGQVLGQIEGEFPVAIDHTSRPQCDVTAANGAEIAHSLVLELVIAEELVPSRNARAATPTGSARVLRTQFGLKLTQRSGLGIAWDNETPPMYDDVPESPPHYANPGNGTLIREIVLSPGSELPPAFEDLEMIRPLTLTE
jgi:hypothetical protein